MTPARALHVHQRCAIGGPVHVPAGRYALDRLTERSVRIAAPCAPYAITGDECRELHVHRPFVLERIPEVLSTGVFLVDAITAQAAIESQPKLLAKGLIRIDVPGPHERVSDLEARLLARGQTVTGDLLSFNPRRTLADHVQAGPHARPALPLSEFGLDIGPLFLDRSGTGTVGSRRDRSERR